MVTFAEFHTHLNFGQTLKFSLRFVVFVKKTLNILYKLRFGQMNKLIRQIQIIVDTLTYSIN